MRNRTSTPLRNLRVQKGIPLSEVARELSLTPSVLRDIEIGKAGTKKERAINIAAYFDTTVEEIFVPTHFRIRLE
ncbi:TPA: helix-turn-helix transcriptional regulator [Bacillus cereus]|nr:helix-turn-helix transcriptional regulator [Bacillus cereus]